jgi:phage tail-like protein
MPLMDANGLRFWMLADERHYRLHGDPPGVQYDPERRSLRLASQRPLPPPPDVEEPGSEAEAISRVERVPQTRDGYGTRAYWDADVGAVMATGALPSAVPIFEPPAGETVTDLAMGYDGVLYLAEGGRVVLQDRRDRWDPVTLEAEGFEAWRLAADPTGGVWILDRAHRQLARVQGLPLPCRAYGAYAPTTARPCEENPDPPWLTIWAAAEWLPDEAPVAIACSPEGRLAVLNWVDGEDAAVRCLGRDGKWSPSTRLIGARHPYSLAWVSVTHVAVLLHCLEAESPVYPIGEEAGNAQPVGDFYPLRDHDGGPFVNGVTLPPYYPTTSGVAPLHHLSLPSFAAQGRAYSGAPLDSESAQTVWHRLYLEASIPPNCGVQVYLAAGDDAEPPVDPAEWHEHQFGELFANGKSNGAPRGAWVSSLSEIPFHPGLALCAREKNRVGLFTALIQRATRRVRTLRGRYLHVRVDLTGDERTSPELWALRAYGSRFSYLNHYLPELYRETLFGDDADEEVSSTEPISPPDFLERFLDNFESILTPLEDRIAGAYLLTDPRTTPQEALEWLGSWIGLGFDTAYPEDRRRQLLLHAPEMFRCRGTLAGLKLALNVATGGAVDGGKIVILEDWRLRRTFATILGADLADEEDPLLAGLAVSGNSYVGDTLFLGDENRKEFLALFSADLPKSRTERAIVQALFDWLAYRVTVLVHQEVEPQDLGLIRRVVELETPAHVISRVLSASWPFLVGAASLVGVDTYLAEKPRPEPVRVGRSQIGLRDLIQRPASLDPRLEGGRASLA